MILLHSIYWELFILVNVVTKKMNKIFQVLNIKVGLGVYMEEKYVHIIHLYRQGYVLLPSIKLVLIFKLPPLSRVLGERVKKEILCDWCAKHFPVRLIQ